MIAILVWGRPFHYYASERLQRGGATVSLVRDDHFPATPNYEL
jgi:hypothetical protein